jgi:DNA-binding Xre family transcriptional regulator
MGDKLESMTLSDYTEHCEKQLAGKGIEELKLLCRFLGCGVGDLSRKVAHYCAGKA